jgi:ABC-type multidrug transport system fused ATPase/permease subunit
MGHNSILRFLIPVRYYYIFSIFLILAASSIQSCTPYLNKLIIDNVFGQGNYHLLYNITSIVIAAAILVSIIHIFRDILISYTTEKIEIHIKITLLEHLRKLPYQYIESQPISKLLSMFQSDIAVFSNLYKTVIPMVFQIFIQIVVSAVLLYTINWKITIMGFLLIPLSIVITALFKEKIRRFADIYQQNIAEVIAKLHESLLGTKEILTEYKMGWENERMDAVFKKTLETKKKFIYFSSIPSNLNLFVYWFTFSILLLYGGNLVAKETITIGELVASLTFFMSLISPVHQLLILFSEYQKSIGGAEKLFCLLNKPILEHPYRINSEINSVSLKNISFYRESNQVILKDIFFEAKIVNTAKCFYHPCHLFYRSPPRNLPSYANAFTNG